MEHYPNEARFVLGTSLTCFVSVFHWRTKHKTFTFKPFHKEIIKELEDIVFREPHNLIINISPRFGKSRLIEYFLAWTYAIQPNCNNIYTSYSDELVKKFSGEIKDILEDDFYQQVFGVSIKSDTKNKSLWKTSFGGEMRATSMGGAITGFGAGNESGESYGGCLAIDDPLKADDARSATAKEHCIDYFKETLLSRRNNDKTPIIIIAQRLCVDDLVGYLLQKYPNDYKLISVPALDENDRSVWEGRLSTDTLIKMRNENPSLFYAQYQQQPRIEGGNLFKEEMFKRGPLPSSFDYTFMTVDTAYKEKQENDYTAALYWGVRTWDNREKSLYLLDMFHKKISAADCEAYLVPFMQKYAQNRFIGAFIEPKGHGIYLNQKMHTYGVPMQSQKMIDDFFSDRRMDKVARANIVIPSLNAHPIIVSDKISEKDYNIIKEELLNFPKAAHDDLCFSGDTLVSTLWGDKPIKEVKVGEYVITPFGLSRVEQSGQTGNKAVISKFGLKATPAHKVFNGSNFEKLSDICYDVLLDKLSYGGLLKWKYRKLSILMDINIDLWGREGIICVSQQQTKGGRVLSDFIGRFGSFIRARQYRRAMSFITKTVMCLITTTLIWSAYRGTNILRSICPILLQELKRPNKKSCWQKFGSKQANGTKAKPGGNGIAQCPAPITKEQSGSWFVRTAAGFISKRGKKSQANTAQAFADGATISIIKEKKEPSGGPIPVYNIKTDMGCYYANGVLVSNCDCVVDAVKRVYNWKVSILDVV